MPSGTRALPSRDNVLIVVDQFEELFRFRRSRQIENSRDEAVAFVKLLLEAARQTDVADLRRADDALRLHRRLHASTRACRRRSTRASTWSRA